MNDNDASKDPPVNELNLYQAFRLMKLKNFDAAKELIRRSLKEAHDHNNIETEALYHSALGLLYKLTGDYKKAYKSYQHAEQLLPDDLSLKILTSILLVEEFHQYETAVRKLEKIYLTKLSDPAIAHHTATTLAISYFHLGKKEKAKQLFKQILLLDFNLLRFVPNVDFKMVSLFISKNFELGLCETFLEQALLLATKTNDPTYSAVIQQLLIQLKIFKDSSKSP